MTNTIDNITKITDYTIGLSEQIKQVLVSASPEVAKATLAYIQATEISHVIKGIIVCIILYIIAYIPYKISKKFPGDNYSDKDTRECCYAVSAVIATIATVGFIISIASTDFVTIVSPEAALAGKVLDKVTAISHCSK